MRYVRDHASRAHPSILKASRNLSYQTPYDRIFAAQVHEPAKQPLHKESRAYPISENLSYPPIRRKQRKAEMMKKRGKARIEWLFGGHDTIAAKLRQQAAFREFSAAFKYWIADHPEIKDALQTVSGTWCSTTYRLRGHTKRIQINLAFYGSWFEINPYVVAGANNDYFFDYLCWAESLAEPRNGGFYDGFNKPEYQVTHPTLLELWRQETFPTFTDWFYNTLLRSDLLLIECRDDGSGGARLVKMTDAIPSSNDNWHVFIIPLRVSNSS